MLNNSQKNNRYGLLGKKLGHSLSPIIHANFGISYGLFEKNENELEDFLTKREFDGINVTVPYKQTVIPFLDEIDSVASSVNAVNTIVNRNGKLYGYNTDICGMEYALNRAGIVLEGKNVAILGTGGTSNTANYVAKKLKADKIIKVGRNSQISYENFCQNQETSVIINTTPLGMYPDNFSKAIDITQFKNLESVFDVVYNPLKTSLIIEAKRNKLKADNGLAMLVEQARLSRNLFDEKNIIDANMTEKTLNAIYKSNLNIVLIGMAGSGKTTIGKEFAKLTNKKFVDLDELIINNEKQSIQEIFASCGEKYFRQCEEKAALSLINAKGMVISTGGGAVCNEKTINSLLFNGKVVLINRDLEKLTTSDRPLYKTQSVSELYKKRKSIYENYSDFSIKNDNLDTAVKELINIYENISY